MNDSFNICIASRAPRMHDLYATIISKNVVYSKNDSEIKNKKIH